MTCGPLTGNVVAVQEQSSNRWQTSLWSPTCPLAAADVESITATLVDLPSGEVVNNRDGQDALSNGFTLHPTSGLLTWAITVADSTIGNEFVAMGDYGRHLLTLSITSTSGRKDHREVLLLIRRILR